MLELHATYEKDPSALHKALILKVLLYHTQFVFVSVFISKTDCKLCRYGSFCG